MSRVLAAMSGGVDSSVAAALLLEEGHDVVGVTMKLWGGATDRGCCSVADVDDARRVAQQLGIDHHVFNFSDGFEDLVVGPYVAEHAAGRTPNPCIECNRHMKFDRLLRRARQLGFDAVATGHHARIAVRPDGRRRVARGADAAKDQSYVLHMLGQEQLGSTLLPVGRLTKAEVRARAAELGLRTAAKPDSQDVCFVARGRESFLSERIALTPGRVLDHGTGDEVGSVAAVELVTVGQRRGLGVAGAAEPRYALAVDPGTGTVVVGGAGDLLTTEIHLRDLTWADAAPAPGSEVAVQASAHGVARGAVVTPDGVRLHDAAPRVAPGQSVVLYEGDEVLGGGRAV